MAELLQEAKRLKHHCILARINAANQLSIRMHASFGFEEVGVMKEVGYKFGKWLDIVIMQKLIGAS